MLSILGLTLAFVGALLLTFYADKSESHEGFVLDRDQILTWDDKVSIETAGPVAERYRGKQKKLKRWGFGLIAVGTAFQIADQIPNVLRAWDII